MLHKPFYDPEKSYEENFEAGPFGAFADGEVFEREGEPEADFLSHKVYQPFGIPAGPLVNGKYVTAAFEKGFDINVYKTVRTREYPCHQWPNIVGVKNIDRLEPDRSEPVIGETEYKEPLSITNSFGVPSMNPDWWQEDMAKAVKSAGKGQVMIGSFQGTKKEGGGTAKDLINDYVLAARLVKETGSPILAANLSCPNEGTADLLCFDTNRVQEIAHRIKDEIGNTPLLLKLAYFKDNDHLRDFVSKLAPIIDGLITINTIPAAVVDPEGKQALPGEGRARSGVCGNAIRWAGLEMVERLVSLRQTSDLDFAIVGSGGVMNPDHYQAYRDGGADAVFSATGAMWNPYLAQEIWESRG